VSYAFLVFKAPWQRATMIAASLPLAVIGNVVRLSLIVGTAEFFGDKAGRDVHDSAIFSMAPYIPAFIGMMYIGSWLEKGGLARKNSTVEAKTA
jgi:exosortase/archaeosortase family protein